MFIDPLEGVLLAYIIFTQALDLKLDGYPAVDSGFDFCLAGLWSENQSYTL